MKNKLRRTITSGKNIIFTYYIKNIIYYIAPRFLSKFNISMLIKDVNSRSDYEYIIDRVNYYNKLVSNKPLSRGKSKLKEFTFGNKKIKGSRYFFDTYEYVKYFDKNLYFEYLFGDITYTPQTPTIVKSRPINNENEDSILINLDKLRHFVFINDTTPFEEKMDKAIFLSYTKYKPHRIDFMKKFHGSSICLCGDVDKKTDNLEWYHNKISLWAHLKYKFILTIEGNDVATNLKWVMSSNSVAIMQKPRYETWFMEGRLVANYHYIEIKDDYSDFEEKVEYYSTHTEEAKQISRNANEYIKQFQNKKREKIISYLVMEKYLSLVNFPPI